MKLLNRKRSRAGGSGSAQASFSMYYASDVHGSEVCWRKFLGASRFYGAEALVMGGDLTGKAMVPIAATGGRYTAQFLGSERSADTEDELEELLKAVRYNGMYPWVASPEEIAAAAADEVRREALFDSVMLDELKRWIALADEKMEGRDVGIFVMAGNDDPWICDEVIASGSAVTACDGKIVRVGDHEMISCSYANPTPWSSPRELDEDALYERLDGLAQQLEAPERSIFNLHVPPYDTGLDRAAEVNPDLTLALRGGQPIEKPVGSKAVREIIERYQPALSVHGHIHESRGQAHIGKTLALNAGSQYNSGRIHGAVIQLQGSEVVSHQLTIG
jgi:Icc-related predicted phosphoesterase